MTQNNYYTAILAERSAVPTLLCGHCHSILSRARIFRNEGDQHQDIECQVIGLCSADDCRAVNCCDEAMEKLENPEQLLDIAS
ncbi:hypothetical protein [Marinobacter oulmenensis]|uniref:Uncharacterized protein n=1 Tax=Marinobacter oulmenensis TaxID=643747 RepID=A0A840UAC2_9GAMM|nr:hypothetical protein [Marinobacter oulmenensis]MBB5322684.1 hypothetical protein [Marinobacter oulmenensis]